MLPKRTLAICSSVRNPKMRIGVSHFSIEMDARDNPNIKNFVFLKPDYRMPKKAKGSHHP